MNTTVILLIIVGVVILYAWAVYNGLSIAKMRISEALSHIDVQLKRRTDLIPNLVEAVKGYVKHEKGVLEEVTKARSKLLDANTTAEKAKANNMLSDTLKSLFAVAESYPDLKASQNFLNLQEELSDTENKIAYARQFYNTNVLDYNTKTKTFPSMIFANMFKFTESDFFEADEADKKPVAVKF